MRTLIFCFVFLAPSFLLATSTPGCGGFDAESASCMELSNEFDRLVETVGTSCDVVGDCTSVGGAGRWCEAYPSLGGSAGGRAVNAASYASGPNASRLSAIASQFAARCEGRRELCSGTASLCTWDAGPILVSCSDHVCTGSPRSCIGGDAGP